MLQGRMQNGFCTIKSVNIIDFLRIIFASFIGGFHQAIMNTDNPMVIDNLSQKLEKSIKSRIFFKLDSGSLFFFLRSIVLAIFPASNSYSRKEKNIYYLQLLGYVLLFAVSLSYGGVSLLGNMAPLFTYLSSHDYPQYVFIAIMIGLVLTCVAVPAWLACWLAFSVQHKIEQNLMILMHKKGFESFKPSLYKHALFIGSSMFEQLFYEALSTKNLHCYQVLLEFNDHYHLYDMQNLKTKEHARQQQQILSFLKGNSRLSASYHEELRLLVTHTINQYYHQANRMAYDCLILCLLEKSFWRKSDTGSYVVEFSEWFHYFMDNHDLSHSQLIELMFTECDRLRSYVPLLQKYQFKNRVEEQLEIYTSSGEEEEENLPVLKI